MANNWEPTEGDKRAQELLPAVFAEVLAACEREHQPADGSTPMLRAIETMICQVCSCAQDMYGSQVGPDCLQAIAHAAGVLVGQQDDPQELGQTFVDMFAHSVSVVVSALDDRPPMPSMKRQ